MTDYHYSMPLRKPVGGTRPGAAHDLPLRQPPAPIHQHSRTVSSNIFPSPNSSAPSNYTAAYNPAPQQQQQQQQQQPSSYQSDAQQPQPGHARRQPSTSTTSSNAPSRGPSSVSISLRRTPSSRSGQSITPTSYVALMRKQKATVWCDRSQQLDPRIAAQQKAAKQRAVLEVVGPKGGGSASLHSGNTGMRSKIRHGKGTNNVGYSPAALLTGASGVPARLSASEVGDEEGSEDEGSLRRQGGSGRSSIGSVGRFQVQQRIPGRLSQGSTPPSEKSPEETPVPNRTIGGDYFQQPKGSGTSGGSGSSGERNDKVPSLGESGVPKVQPTKGADDLMRRGSVDERAMTMKGPRLFVANPDLSD